MPITLTINDRPVTVEKGATILDAARAAGVRIPTLCHLPGLPPSGACRVCVVELEGRPGLVPSCAFPADEGMKVRTHTPRVLEARQTITELLLANHVSECPTCVRSPDCELRQLAAEHTVREIRFAGRKREIKLDVSSAAIVRDRDKCILCGRCVRVCEEIEGVGAIDFSRRGFQTRVSAAHDDDLTLSRCVGCGQCVVVCPTGALSEQSSERDVWEALRDPKRTVVVQTAPAVRVALAELFGLPAGTECTGKMVAALRRLGFAKVFDTVLAADLTIVEEAHELVSRLTSGGTLPMMTSCSPGWIQYVERFRPEFIPNLSSCKSPQQMLGAVVKRVWAKRLGLDPAQVFFVSVMPCTAKKLEARRPEMAVGGVPDVDAVLTTRELGRMIRRAGLDFGALPDEAYDSPLGAGSGAGELFGATGGVMEAAVRTAHHIVTGKNLEAIELAPVRGEAGLKEAEVQVGALTLKIAVVSSLARARDLLDRIAAGAAYHFVEVMTCPGGCISGGGQPLGVDRRRVAARMRATYGLDAGSRIRVSHENPDVLALYGEVYGEPGSHAAHEHLHTRYSARGSEG